MNNLVIKNLSQGYSQINVLEDVNHQFSVGVHGILGKNGVGKTTLLKTMAGLQPFQSGLISFKGQEQYKHLIGYVPQYVDFYPYWNSLQTLNFFLSLYGCQKPKSELIELLEQVGLRNPKQRVGGFSGGMKRRLALAVSLLNDPELLIIDEPTAGIDPEGRMVLRRIFGSLSQEKTIIMSTHNLSDLDWLARSIVILDQKKIAFSGSPKQLKASQQGCIWEVAVQNETDLPDYVKVISLAQKEEGLVARVISKDSIIKNSIPIEHPSLEEAYLAFLQQ